jgi:hypothetical protein
MNKVICFISSLIIILLICIIAKNQNKTEKWSDVDLNSFAPMFDSLKYSGLNISKFSNGFKLEDDNTKCVCQCNRKCKPPTSTISSSSQVSSGIGYRINYFPWFVPK